MLRFLILTLSFSFPVVLTDIGYLDEEMCLNAAVTEKNTRTTLCAKKRNDLTGELEIVSKNISVNFSIHLN